MSLVLRTPDLPRAVADYTGVLGFECRQHIPGVLAVVVASPCTAPFMGAALGFAIGLPAIQALLIFATLGLGMALPYLVASWVPAVARVLPRSGEWTVTFKHALRNSLIPFVTALGIMAGYLFSGAIVVEQVYAIPGLGRLMLGAIADRNYPLIQTSILVVTCAFVVINAVIDLLYRVIDKRAGAPA